MSLFPLHMADLRKLIHLVTLVETANFSTAARRLGITQSALSRSIQALEEAYGFRIFERGRGPAVLTAAGRSLFPTIRRLVQDASALDRQAAEIGKAEAGSTSFGMGPLGAVTILPSLLEAMLRERPGIRAHPLVDGGPAMIEQTLADEIEFCCVADIMLPDHDRLASSVIARLPVVLIARAGHPLLSGVGAVSDYPLIGGSTASPQNADYHPAIRCDNNGVMKAVAMVSDAIWLTAQVAAQAEIEAGRLCVLPHRFDTPDQEIRLVLVRHHGRTLSPAAQYLERTIRRIAGDLFAPWHTTRRT